MKKEYYAKIAEYGGTTRGKIPSKLVREMGARPGNYLVFTKDNGTVTVSVSRKKGKVRKKSQ
jgi:hypothetical protein